MNNALLETRHLCVTIAGKQVCRDLNLHLETGHCWGILGRNGIGKTTLLHTLAGLRAPAGGEILLQGTPLTQLTRRAIAKRIGVLLQTQHDMFPSTVLESVLVGRHPHLKSWQWESADDLAYARHALSTLDLKELETRTLDTLSGGERRRTALAALLTQDPALFLLDEPVNHLDIHYQIKTLELLTGLCRSKGRTLVLVLHDINLTARFCDRVLLLFGNDITEQGLTQDVLHEQNLHCLFGHEMRRITTEHGNAFMPR